MIFQSDMHIHTTISNCCKDKEQTPENVVQLLAEKGYKRIGFIDHLWDSKDVQINSYISHNAEKILKFHEFIHSRAWEIEVLVGCEADMKAPESFGITHELKEQLDYVTIATDHFHQKFVQQPSEQTPRALARHMLEFFISAVESKLPDILVHPFFPYGYIDIYDQAIDCISDAEFIDAFSLAAQNNVGIELNFCFLGLKSGSSNFSRSTPIRFLSLAKQAGCKFTLGSDSHSLEAFKVLPKLQELAKELGITDQNIHQLAKL